MAGYAYAPRRTSRVSAPSRAGTYGPPRSRRLKGEAGLSSALSSMMQAIFRPDAQSLVEEVAMEKTLLHSSKLAKPSGIFSAGVKVAAGQLIFVSGQVARNAA